MRITPKNFVDVLRQTSLTPEEREAVVDLLQTLSPNQIEQIYKILLEDAKDTQRILKKLEMQNEKALLKLKQDVKQKKRTKQKSK